MKNFTLCFILFSGFQTVFSQWNLNPVINTGVCIQPYGQQDARIVTDSKGGAILTWLDFRGDATQTAGDIFVQRMDKNGINKWVANGVVLCNLPTDQTAPSMVEDGNGGAIIAWNDWRNGNRDIYAQKIDSSGNVRWTANGVSVVTKANHQQDAKLIYDGAGGAIIVWQDSVSGAYDVFAQRIDSAGTPLWTSTGVAICSVSGSQINPKIETDGAGGAIITWQDKRNGVDYDIYAQRINSSGVFQWTANGVAVCNAAGTQSNPKIEPDGAGGAYIGWQDKRNGNDYDVYANRLNSSGVVQWNTNGWGVSVNSGNQSAIDMTSDGVNGVILAWKDDRNGTFDIYFQRADPSGAMQYSLGGNSMPLASYSQINPNVVGDGSGGAIIVWQDSSAGTWDVQCGGINAAGIIQWNSPVGTAAGSQTFPKSVSDGAGGCIFVFQDKRNLTDFNIYAHRILSDGTSASVNGSMVSDFMFQIFPNPFSETAILRVTNPRIINYELKIYDVFGKEMNAEIIRNADGFVIRRGNLLQGIYFYQITSDIKHLTSTGFISTGKFILTE